MANNQFSKRIIRLNKDMICISTNVLFNEFLRKIVAMNVISLWKCQEVISRTTRATSHSNCHSLAVTLFNISLLIKHIIENSLFCEQLGRIGLWSNLQWLAFPDLFADGIARFATGLELARYVCSARGNWDNYKSEDEFATSNKEDKEADNIEEPLDDQYALYGMYN